MFNFIFQPFFEGTILNTICSVIFIIAVMCVSLDKPIKRFSLMGLSFVLGIGLTCYSHFYRETDGFTIGLLIGLALATYSCTSLGASGDLLDNKKMN